MLICVFDDGSGQSTLCESGISLALEVSAAWAGRARLMVQAINRAFSFMKFLPLLRRDGFSH